MKWNPFISIVEGVGGFFRDRQKIKAKTAERKDELVAAKHTAQVEKVKRGDAATTDYDNLVIAESRNTIVDEVLISWTLALITCLFIPSLAPYAQAGFEALDGCPTWFQVCVVGIYIRTLGLRFLFNGRSLFGKVVK